jgi:hypothetical protein
MSDRVAFFVLFTESILSKRVDKEGKSFSLLLEKRTLFSKMHSAGMFQQNAMGAERLIHFPKERSGV